jgi:predicted  nucleic acid-binding Zn-ribbon protein
VSAKKSEAAAGERWLEELESTVRQAGETIATLRREKADLESQVKELQAGAGSDPGEGGDDGGESAAAAWREERQAIRDRVEQLTERLEGLLDDGE